MRLVSDPCPRWAVFEMLRRPPAGKAAQQPRSQISVMLDGKQPRLYCCHSLLTRDAADAMHVLSVGVDLQPALDAQGHDGEAIVASIADACRRGGGDAAIPTAAAQAMRAVSQVLRIEWIADALDTHASVICLAAMAVHENRGAVRRAPTEHIPEADERPSHRSVVC
jgi:hypothetical protein